jgi:hypothetical protein
VILLSSLCSASRGRWRVGYAFIARPNGGERTARYIGYQHNLVVDPGTLLLDATATADIDG